MVGLLLPRSAEMGISALAVLRAGGAYVPLDAAHPQARLDHMVGACGARLLLTAAATADLGERLGAPCLRVDLPEVRTATGPGGGTASGAPAPAVPCRGTWPMCCSPPAPPAPPRALPWSSGR
ncbi:AMP-binding protein [Streptacidiphilus sp. 4-A2]|nr:AMP-binding protein [Streptacidiphilus sp. 4-A2]